MDATIENGFALLILIFVTLLGFGSAQEDDFSSPIKCFTCTGAVEDSECSDPLDVKYMNTTYKTCENGICLKYTVYEGHKLQMLRGCSSDLNFHLTMIDGVCRTERNGNGYLCMCGKNLCNASPPSTTLGRGSGVILLLPALLTVLMLIKAHNSWRWSTRMSSSGSSTSGTLDRMSLSVSENGVVFPVR